jgi:hypothetical protein
MGFLITPTKTLSRREESRTMEGDKPVKTIRRETAIDGFHICGVVAKRGTRKFLVVERYSWHCQWKLNDTFWCIGRISAFVLPSDGI